MTGLVIGASGFLGAHVYRRLLDRGAHVHGTCGRHPRSGLQAIDLLDQQATARYLLSLRPEPDVIFWCAKRNHGNDDERTLNENGLRNLTYSVPDATGVVHICGGALTQSRQHLGHPA